MHYKTKLEYKLKFSFVRVGVLKRRAEYQASFILYFIINDIFTEIVISVMVSTLIEKMFAIQSLITDII